uniref:Skp1 domain-containing protein n=1 Tax=Macrostomum lignano TaxID=282301 RepID=A0A1I8FZ21_9PLAT
MKFVIVFKVDRQVIETETEYVRLPPHLAVLTESEWLKYRESTDIWNCSVEYEGEYYEAVILQVILSKELQPTSSIRFIRELVAKKVRLCDVLAKVQPRVFTEDDAKEARRRYQS